MSKTSNEKLRRKSETPKVAFPFSHFIVLAPGDGMKRRSRKGWLKQHKKLVLKLNKIPAIPTQFLLVAAQTKLEMLCHSQRQIRAVYYLPNNLSLLDGFFGFFKLFFTPFGKVWIWKQRWIYCGWLSFFAVFFDDINTENDLSLMIIWSSEETMLYKIIVSFSFSSANLWSCLTNMTYQIPKLIIQKSNPSTATILCKLQNAIVSVSCSPWHILPLIAYLQAVTKLPCMHHTRIHTSLYSSQHQRQLRTHLADHQLFNWPMVRSLLSSLSRFFERWLVREYLWSFLPHLLLPTKTHP